MLEEFFQQGDKERAEGLPVSPMCDRHSTSVALSQINFTEYIVAPLLYQVTAQFCLHKETSVSRDNTECGMVSSALHEQRIGRV